MMISIKEKVIMSGLVGIATMYMLTVSPAQVQDVFIIMLVTLACIHCVPNKTD